MNQPSQSEKLFKEIGVLTKKTVEYHGKIQAAKTRAKVNFYRKKMVRNNKQIEKLLVVADILEKQEAKAAQEIVEEAA